jgi:hypothetical protein
MQSDKVVAFTLKTATKKDEKEAKEREKLNLKVLFFL